MLNETIPEVVVYKPTIIYKIKAPTELKELSNKFLVRILDGEYTFAWNAEYLDHHHARELLIPYATNISDYEDFMLDKDLLLCSILKYGEKSIHKFSKKFFETIEKTDFGYKVKWK